MSFYSRKLRKFIIEILKIINIIKIRYIYTTKIVPLFDSLDVNVKTGFLYDIFVFIDFYYIIQRKFD